MKFVRGDHPTRSGGNSGYAERRVPLTGESRPDPKVEDTPERAVSRDGWSISDVRFVATNGLVPSASSVRSANREMNAASQPLRQVSVHKAADNLAKAQRSRANALVGQVQFRVPTTADLKTLFNSGDVPESVLKDRVQVALSRMASEKRLKSSDSVPDLIKKIFPAPKVFDEKEYENAVDVTDRTKIYESVLDAEAKISSADKPKLKTTMQAASSLMVDCAADSTNLASVFGTKKDTAKAIYQKGKSALDNAINTMDASVTTDYNLDDPEIGLGGWARFSQQKVHFTPRVAKVTNEKEAKATIIHEASHLADATVKDKGYYGSSGFEAMAEDEKITNAAHFEEVPRRKMGTSKYPDKSGGFIDFKPGTSATGAPLTFEEQGKRKADEYFRKAWDKAVDVHEFLRDIRKDELAGSTSSFNAHRIRILEISKLMHLTVHEQAPAKAINQVDIALAEGVAHSTIGLKRTAAGKSVSKSLQLQAPPLTGGFTPGHPKSMGGQLELKPMPPPSADPLIVTTDDAAAKIIKDTIIARGPIVGTFDEDKKLMDWLVNEYKKAL